MFNQVETGFLITIGGAIVGLFIRIENRLTKVETSITFIKENIHGCQPPSDNDTK